MTINELISGNIYSSLNYEGVYIFRSDGLYKYKTRLALGTAGYAEEGTIGGIIQENLRLPTQEEILQLEACERAGKYQKIKIIYYEIY